MSAPGERPFRFLYPLRVRFGDLDAMRHVNNAVYLTYLESARLAYWLHTTRRQGLDALDMILARVEIDYRSPLAWDEAITVGVRCASLSRSSFVLEFEVRAGEDARLVAEARKVMVHYDWAAGKPLPLPEPLRALIRAQDPEVNETRA